MMEKGHILAEIRRTAEENEGRPLGRARFAEATGIREADWLGRYWARWSDALVEAGYEPNRMQERFGDEAVLDKLVAVIRRLGRMPTVAELRMERRHDPDFPSDGVFARYGRKSDLAARVAEHCHGDPNAAEVLKIVEPLVQRGDRTGTAASGTDGEESDAPDEVGPNGFVYLVKSGRHYKIGHTANLGRRSYDLAIQLPEPATRIHVIATLRSRPQVRILLGTSPASTASSTGTSG